MLANRLCHVTATSLAACAPSYRYLVAVHVVHALPRVLLLALAVLLLRLLLGRRRLLRLLAGVSEDGHRLLLRLLRLPAALLQRLRHVQRLSETHRLRRRRRRRCRRLVVVVMVVVHLRRRNPISKCMHMGKRNIEKKEGERGMPSIPRTLSGIHFSLEMPLLINCGMLPHQLVFFPFSPYLVRRRPPGCGVSGGHHSPGSLRLLLLLLLRLLLLLLPHSQLGRHVSAGHHGPAGIARRRGARAAGLERLRERPACR